MQQQVCARRRLVIYSNSSNVKNKGNNEALKSQVAMRRCRQLFAVCTLAITSALMLLHARIGCVVAGVAGVLLFFALIVINTDVIM